MQKQLLHRNERRIASLKEHSSSESRLWISNRQIRLHYLHSLSDGVEIQASVQAKVATSCPLQLCERSSDAELALAVGELARLIDSLRRN